MDVNKHVSLLAPTHPSFDMCFDRVVNGTNYLFGESVSLISFIKVRTAFVYVFPLRVLTGKHLSSYCSVLCLCISRLLVIAVGVRVV